MLIHQLDSLIDIASDLLEKYEYQLKNYILDDQWGLKV
jgi:hypothetical protein